MNQSRGEFIDAEDVDFTGVTGGAEECAADDPDDDATELWLGAD